MTTQTFETAVALAGALARRVRSAIEARPTLVLGLPTGHTPLPFYAALRAETAAGGIDWSGVRTFNLDEFVGLECGAPGTYRHYMDRELFGPIGMSPEHIGFLDGCAPDLDAECARYERDIAAAGGIDIMILGIGANGHIGFNEPGPELEPRTHRVRLLEETRAANRGWFGDRPDDVPSEALSIGMATILQSRQIVLIATGETKTQAVKRMLNGSITTALPASFLQLHPDVTVMLDRAATPR